MFALLLVSCFVVVIAQEDENGLVCYVNNNGPLDGNTDLATAGGCTYCTHEVKTEGDRVVTLRQCLPECRPIKTKQDTRVCCQSDLCNYDKDTAENANQGRGGTISDEMD